MYYTWTSMPKRFTKGVLKWGPAGYQWHAAGIKPTMRLPPSHCAPMNTPGIKVNLIMQNILVISMIIHRPTSPSVSICLQLHLNQECICETKHQISDEQCRDCGELQGSKIITILCTWLLLRLKGKMCPDKPFKNTLYIHI